MEHSGIISMLRDNKIEDLKRMYNLFGRVSEGHLTMRSHLSDYVRETGKALITDEEKQKDHLVLIQNLLDLKEKYDKILSGAFNNDKQFSQTLNQVNCLQFCNLPTESKKIRLLNTLSI